MTSSQDGEAFRRKLKSFFAIFLTLAFFSPSTVHAETTDIVDRWTFKFGVIELPHIIEKPKVQPKKVVKSEPVKSVSQNKPSTKNLATKGYDVCSCVSYAKYRTGYKEIIGVARNWRVNSTEPVVGGVVVLKEGPVGHVAVIEGIEGDKITISEANYSRCKQGVRVINKKYKKIIGYWHA